MCKIKIKLIKLIALFEYLVYNEGFKGHKVVLKLYGKIWSNIEGKSSEEFLEEDFIPLTNIARLFFEAVPSDDKLSDYLVEKMQEFYELYEQTVK